MKTIYVFAALALAGCAQYSTPPETRRSVAKSLHEARGNGSEEKRVALYLQAAAEAAPRIGSADQPTAARETYNAAAAELAVLLRTADGGRWWNHPITASAGDATYRLHFQAGNGKGVWSPDFFTALVLARTVPAKSIARSDRQEGVGGALIGIRKKGPPEPFAPRVGVTAPVTATLDFHGHDATLALRNPSAQPQARVAGTIRPLAADFSAPLAYYPSVNETIAGLMGALSVSSRMNETGMYMLQPYDRDRIPLIFVHGLISTARMWRNVANEIDADPELRKHYQCWVFHYPTGNPVAYSALRFREELAKAQSLFGLPHGVILVGHSMGGIVSRMQAVTVNRAAWERTLGPTAANLFTAMPDDSLIHRAIIFNSNPKVRRIVFICTPHRGSGLATGGIGELAMRLISLPSTLVKGLSGTATKALAAATGSQRLPNSIFSLSPKNPTLLVLDKLPIQAPHHSIIGDRGKGDSPNSSDGIVPYWSSHLDSAQSEKIVPGPHGSCELPETIEELKRILRLHLQANTL